MISETLDLESLYSLSESLEREIIAANITEQEIHFHVIDTIVNLQDNMENKAKLLSASIPHMHLISSRILELSFKSIISPEEANSLLKLVFLID